MAGGQTFDLNSNNLLDVTIPPMNLYQSLTPDDRFIIETNLPLRSKPQWTHNNKENTLIQILIPVKMSFQILWSVMTHTTLWKIT